MKTIKSANALTWYPLGRSVAAFAFFVLFRFYYAWLKQQFLFFRFFRIIDDADRQTNGRGVQITVNLIVEGGGRLIADLVGVLLDNVRLNQLDFGGGKVAVENHQLDIFGDRAFEFRDGRDDGVGGSLHPACDNDVRLRVFLQIGGNAVIHLAETEIFYRDNALSVRFLVIFCHPVQITV